MIGTCAECKYYKTYQGDLGGECRRNPPVTVTTAMTKTSHPEGDTWEQFDLAPQFPEVEKNDWCGEFRLRESKNNEWISRQFDNDESGRSAQIFIDGNLFQIMITDDELSVRHAPNDGPMGEWATVKFNKKKGE